MNETAAHTYRERMNRVVDYINDHLYENLSVDLLSEVAFFSKYHFHRQFSEYTGISVFKFIQLIRLRRASYQLVFRKHNQIIDIAISAGFENPESFSHAFKKTFGQTPSQFRKKPEWKSWQEKYQFMNRGGQRMNMGKHSMQVNVVLFKETKVAVLEHRGSPELINNSVQTFIEWRKQNNLRPQVSETYNIIYDDPETTEPEKFRVDLCASIHADVKQNSYGVITKVISGGRCALFRHTGSDATIGKSLHYLYATWLPESGEELRNAPCFFHRVNLFPDVPEHEIITDIYLPLQ